MSSGGSSPQELPEKQLPSSPATNSPLAWRSAPQTPSKRARTAAAPAPAPAPARLRRPTRRPPRSNWPGSQFDPKSVKRVGDIFDGPKLRRRPERQGHNGDCWLMAALCVLSNKPGLIERVCVARDEDVGVYGFVFHRDG
ncbi:hypothetical protein L209DRAFT_747195 [Thermothelomyces heterothallicus CBS 203.75]